MKKQKLLMLLAVVMAIILAAATAGAADLILDETVEVMHQDSGLAFNVSVYPGAASYSGKAGAVTGIFGDGTVLDYRFFTTERPAGTDEDTLLTYADGGAGFVLPVTSPTKDTVSGRDKWPDAWTTSDPGAGFANPADFTTDTIAYAQNIDGTINIFGMSSGSVYVIYGTYNNSNTITLTMSGPGQPDVVASKTISAPGKNVVWISKFDFAYAGEYDTITYKYTNTDLDASRARFMGIVIDGNYSPLNPNPENGGVGSALSDLELKWSNLDPNGIDETLVDVYFGSDPALGAGTQLLAGVTDESVTVDASTLGQTYYWRVDSYVGQDNDPTVGEVMSFVASDLPVSYVDAGSDLMTWAGNPVQLVPVIDDDGQSALTYSWGADPDAGVVFDSNTIEAPIFTLVKAPYAEAKIANAGFEAPIRADGDYDWYPDDWGWYKTDYIGNWNPGTDVFGGIAPEGENIAYIDGDSDGECGLAQVLNETLTTGTTYTLTVEVGNDGYYAWNGYKVQLLAGGTPGTTGEVTEGGLLAEDNNSMTIAAGEFKTSTVAFTYDEVADANKVELLGQPLQIRLIANEGSEEIDFDDVKLVADPPFPPSTATTTVTLTFAVNDAANPDKVKEDTLTIDVYDTACEMARYGEGLAEVIPGDIDGNCVTDLVDLSIMAGTWLNDTGLTGAVTK